MIALCQHGLAEDSTRIVLYNLLAAAHAGRGEIPEAIASLRQAVRLSPEFTAGWVNLGNMISNLGRHEEALPYLLQAAAFDPENVPLLRRLAQAHMEVGQHAEALPVLRQAAALLPPNPILTGYLGLAHEGSGDDEQALAAYLRALELDPSYEEVQFRAAAVARRLGRTALADSSRAAHERLLQVGGGDDESRSNVRQLRAAIEAAPGEAVHHARLAGFYLFHDYLPESLALVDRAAELEPDNAWLLNEFAGLLGRKGYTEEALRFYRRALHVDPDYSMALVNAGNLLNAVQRSAEALPLLQRAVTLLPEDPRPHFYLGLAHRSLGDTSAARDQLERGLELAADDDELRQQMQSLLNTLDG